jgi:hypothetical protein
MIQLTMIAAITKTNSSAAMRMKRGFISRSLGRSAGVKKTQLRYLNGPFPFWNLQRDSSAGWIRLQIDFVVDPQTSITTRG